jgi:hypothetical protein
MRKDGEAIPPSSAMDLIMEDRHNRNAGAFPVDLGA